MAAEKLFENKIKKHLEEQGAWFVKYWAGAKFTRSGVPDILCCLNGMFLAIEVKASNGRPSELQLDTINEIRKADGVAIVLYPEQFNTFKRLVKVIKNGSFGRATILQYDFDVKIHP